MSQYEKYFDDIVNDAYNEIKSLVDDIRKVGVCSSCGGIFLVDNCLFCRTESAKLKEVIPVLEKRLKRFNDIIANLPKETIKINKLFNLLYSITNVKIESIDELLQKYNYEELYNSYENEIIKKVGTNYSYSKLDINVIETIIFRNKRTKELFPLLVKEAIDKNIVISYESFREITKNYILEEMEKMSIDPVCNILPIDELKQNHKDRVTVAQAGYNRVEISEEEIKLLYYKGSNALINSIFHEIKHIEQIAKFFVMATHHPFVVREIKEYVLTKYVPGYYVENYKNISFEIEAEYYALIRTRDFLVDLGYEINMGSFELELNSLNNHLNDPKRYLDNNETSVDELFDKTILDKPQLLNYYKVLKLLYRIDNNLVYPKSIDELIDDFNKVINDSKYDIGEKESYKNFYNYYVSKKSR